MTAELDTAAIRAELPARIPPAWTGLAKIRDLCDEVDRLRAQLEAVVLGACRDLTAAEARPAQVEAELVSLLREHSELTLAGRASDPFLDGYAEALTWAADSIAYRAAARGEGDRDRAADVVAAALAIDDPTVQQYIRRGGEGDR